MSELKTRDVFYNLIKDSTGIKYTDAQTILPSDADFYTENYRISGFENLKQSTLNTLFYLETPFETTPGYYNNEEVFIVKAIPYNEEAINNLLSINKDKYLLAAKEKQGLNEGDGDTLYFINETLQDGSSSFNIGNRQYNSLKDFINLPFNSKGKFGVRFLGINTPEIPHYISVPVKESEITTKKLSELENNKYSNYTYLTYNEDGTKRSNDSILEFCNLGGTFYEIKEKNYTPTIDIVNSESNYNVFSAQQKTNDKLYMCKVVSINESNSTIAKGIAMKETVEEMLGQASDIILMLDKQTLSSQTNHNLYPYNVDFFESTYDSSFGIWKECNALWKKFFSNERSRYIGYNAWGQDNNKRFLGTVYLKVKIPELNNEEHWINLSKYLIQKYPNDLEILPDYNGDPRKKIDNGFCSDAFKLWTYDFLNQQIVDAFTSLNESEEFTVKDRNKVLKAVSGFDADTLKEYSVILGDMSFIVPPVNIRCVTQNKTEKVPLLRSKGQVAKNAPKSEKLIELKLYFNNSQNINGIPYEHTYNTKYKITDTYYMNGLRSLIAQFKLTPFLPIDNEYINKVLNVYAVTLMDLQISTMPGFPKCLEATLTLQEFNYRIYMPELPLPYEIDGVKGLDENVFASVIHFPLMRYYYQRLLQKGEEIKNYDVTSEEYIKATYGSITPLIPMKFKDPTISFYLPDKNWLDKRIQAAMEKEKTNLLQTYKTTDGMKKIIEDLAPLYDSFDNTLSENLNDKFKNLIIPRGLTFPNEDLYINPQTGKMELKKEVSFPLILHGSFENGTVKNFTSSNDISSLFDYGALRVFKVDPNDVDMPANEQSIAFESYSTYCDNPEVTKRNNYDSNPNTIFNEIINMINGGIKSGHSLEKVQRFKIDKNDPNQCSLCLDLKYELPNTLENEYERELFKKKMLSITEIVEEEDLFSYNAYGALCINFSVNISLKRQTVNTGVNGSGGTLYLVYADEDSTISFNDEVMNLLKYCKSAVDDSGVFAGSIYDNMKDDTTKYNNMNKYDDGTSIRFEKYDLGEDIHIESLRCVYSNSITRQSLQAIDGYGHQYCGGQDMTVEFSITTKNKDAIALLVNLPRLAAQYVTDYKMILANWPLRIESEITRLLGVHEVLIESVDTTTVPNFPGLYGATIRLTSVDRSTRNRESLKKIEEIKNNGAVTTENSGDYTINNYFNLKKVLGKAEIYPDLELPTLDELNKLGFTFINYYNPEISTRVYVDPDFYFIYAHSLTSEIFRNAILKSFDKNREINLTKAYQISDSFGGATTLYQTDETDDLPYRENKDKQNEMMKLQTEEIEKSKVTIDNAINNLSNDIFERMTDNELITSKLAQTIAGLQTPIWNITENYNFPLREKQYELIKEENDYCKVIDTAKNKVLDSINKTLDTGIDLTNYDLEIKKPSNRDLQSVEETQKWAENRIYLATNKIASNTNFIFMLINFVTNDLSEIYNTLGQNERLRYINTIFKNLFLAYADAVTGSSSCNQVQYLGVSKILETSEDKASLVNWKLRPFLNYGDEAINNLIPYCKIKDNQDSEAYFASSFEQAEQYGVTFGVFQIPMLSKEQIIPFIEDETEKTKILTSEENFFFLDDYYRGLQLYKNEINNKLLAEYKHNLLIDPAYCAIAFARNLLVWYKRLVNENIAISLYELIKSEASDTYKNILTNNESDNALISIRKIVNNHDIDKYANSASTLSNKVLKLYIQAYVAAYCDYYQNNSEAFTDEGLTANGVPDNLIEYIKKRGEKDYNYTKENLLNTYTNLSKKYTDTETIIDDISKTETDFILEILNSSSIDMGDSNSLKHYETIISVLKTQMDFTIGINSNSLKTIMEQINLSYDKIAFGKIIGLSMLLLDNGKYIYDYMNTNSKNIDALNSLIIAMANDIENTMYDKEYRYLCALNGRNVISLEKIGTKKQTAEELIKIAASERVYIDRSNKIDAYLKDSFFDMIVNDKRGRMIRAFPTYYMLFIDEGRKIGLWKLHDNFYNMNAIASIYTTDSRKIAASTAQITMTNMFKTFSNDDPVLDYNISEINNVRYNMRDAFNSIFSPRTYYLKEELNRTMKETPNSVQLQPGIRIHLRLGYSANAADLPIIFNGNIAEVSTGDLVQIIAQGDGKELLNPITHTDDAEDLKHEEDFFLQKMFENWITNGATPKEILTALLGARGSWLENQIRTLSSGRFFNTNPYGITHFGDVYYDNIFSAGEVVQNIYEVSPRSTYGKGSVYTGLEELYDTEDTPVISMHVHGKNFWDILHICASVQPDFIASVVPFGMRSSIYFGNNRSYYAYEYYKKDNLDGSSVVLEKRKPFQQRHIYTSYTDIIHNNIKASGENIKTNAVGLYQSKRLFGSKVEQTETLYADYSIYPEFQKSMIVDTQLWAKGMFMFGNWFGLTEKLSKNVGEKAAIKGAKEICWRMTASALKNSMKEMYDGEITVMGDPSVKPYDRMFIEDSYERISGECEVEAVVHSFNIDTGYTTSIYADCISVVDDMYEQYAHHVLSTVVCSAVTAGLTNFISKVAFDSAGKPVVNAILAKSAKGVSSATKYLKGLFATLDKESTEIAEEAIKQTTKKSIEEITEGLEKNGLKSILGDKAYIGGNIALFLLEIAATIIITNNCSEFIYRTLQNLEVLQIFPMKKKGRAMVASIDGHKGCVVGSATENMQDDYTNFLISLFDGKNAGVIENILDTLFGNDGIHKAANKLRRDNNMPEVTENMVTTEKQRKELTDDIYKLYVSQASKNRRAILNIERITDLGASSINYLKNYAIDYNEDIAKSTDLIRNTIPIEGVKELIQYFNHEEFNGNNFLKIFNLKTEGTIKTVPITFRGEKFDIEYYQKEKNVMSVPVLRYEAIYLLVDCINELAKEFKLDSIKTQLPFKNPKVFITSATVLSGKLNSEGKRQLSWENTGYSFRLFVNGYTEEQMNDFCETMKEKYKSQGANNFFTYQKSKDSMEYLFIVNPVKSDLIEEGVFDNE